MKINLKLNKYNKHSILLVPSLRSKSPQYTMFIIETKGNNLTIIYLAW